MSTQKNETTRLPRPHVFTPPDLTLIIDDGFRKIHKPLTGRYYHVIVGRECRNPADTFSHIPLDVRIPRGVRGCTSVSYVPTSLYYSTLPFHIKGRGWSWLHTADVFSEPFGVALATVRAITDLIQKHQPVNAQDIGVCIGRYLDDVIDIHGQTTEEQDTLDRAADKLAEAIRKCPR